MPSDALGVLNKLWHKTIKQIKMRNKFHSSIRVSLALKAGRPV